MSNFPSYPPPGQGQQQASMPPQQAAPSYPSGPPAQYPTQHPGMPQRDARTQAMVDALDAEVDDLKKHRSGADKADWLKVKSPANTGDTSETIVRILPAWPTKPNQGEFWHKTYSHFIWAEFDGRKVRMPITCAREMSKIQNPTQAPLPCACCERKDAAEAAGDKKEVDNWEARPRFLVNALDCENLNRHWKQNAQTGQMEPVACVMQIGPGLLRKLNTVIHARGDITSLTNGRLVKILTTRVGRQAQDVRYDCIDASEAIPIVQGFENIRLIDLAAMDQIRDYAEVLKMIGGQPAPQRQMPYQPPQQQAYQPPQQAYQPPQQAYQPPQQAYQPPPQAASAPGPGAPPQPVWDAQRNQWVIPAPPQQAAPVQQPPPPPQPVWDAASNQWVIPGTVTQQVAPPQSASPPASPGVDPGAGEVPPF